MSELVDAFEHVLRRSDGRALVADIDRISKLALSLTLRDATANVDQLLRCVELLEDLDLSDLAARTLALVFDATANTPAKGVEIRNHRALLAVYRGDYAHAISLLDDAHIDAGRGNPAMLDLVRANLAGANLLAGNLVAARKWADVVTRTADTNPAVDSLVASVRTSAAGLSLDGEEFVQAAAAQRRALEMGLATANQRDPAALAAFASVVSTQFQLAMSEGDQERARLALDLTEIGLQRISATLGRNDPRTLLVLSNSAAARFELACAEGAIETIWHTLDQLRDAARLCVEALGARHPQALVAAANASAALFEAARVDRSPALARTALVELRQIAELTRSALGADHPQSVTALSNLASAEFDLARVDGSRDSAERALASLQAATVQSVAVLGADHPATLVLEQELHLCQAWASDDEEGGDGILLTKRRTAVRHAFDEDYLSIGDAAKALAGDEPDTTVPDFATLPDVAPDHNLRVGDVVEGRVVRILRSGVWVDLGSGVTGMIPPSEMPQEPKHFYTGNVFEVRVINDGRIPLVSIKQAQRQRASHHEVGDKQFWDALEDSRAREEAVRGMVIEAVEDGLILDIGVMAFLPDSQIGQQPVRDLQSYVNRELHALITEIDRGRVVLSRRALLEQRRQDGLIGLETGQVHQGVVSSIGSFGAVIDLGDVDGLVPVSELSWQHVDRLSEVVSVGQQVSVKVVDIDLLRGGVTLSLRAAQPDP